MAEHPRARRRPAPPTTEEVALDLLQQIADDLHGLKTVAYWVVGAWVAAAAIWLVVALSA